MADALVSFALDKISLLLEEKVSLLSGVESEAESIRDELERMVAFLRVADAMGEKDAEIKVWVKQVREAAYEMEDALDRFMLNRARDQGRNCLLNCLFKIKKLRDRMTIAYEIQGLKSRVSNISDRHKRYGFASNLQDHGFSSKGESNRTDDWRGNALLLEENELVGIDGPKRQIIGWLLEAGPGHKVVSVVGMGGLGKTTLVKKVFDDAEVRKHFHCHVWITVSETFKVEEVLIDLIEQCFDEVKQDLPEGLYKMNATRLKEVAKNFLLQKRYIVVFDDVWTIAAWESIHLALPNEPEGSRVIITTRINDIGSCSVLESEGYKYDLKPLSEEQSWTLFSRKTFQGKTCPAYLEEISKNILRKCEGLPLAIVAISGVLLSKNDNNVEEWEAFNQCLGAEMEANERLESVRVILQISFDALPHYLKPCFLYLSVFPEDHPIEHNTLIRLWITEGFVKERNGTTLEEVAECYLNELINRSLISVVKCNDDGSLKLGHIHDIYRQIVISISRDHNFVTALNEHNSCPNKVRCLSLHSGLEDLPNKRHVSRLRSLLTFGVESPLSTPRVIKLLNSCRMVKVLDLRGVPLEIFPKEIMKLLHLKYLSLRNTGIKSIPRSIEKLRNLEVLDMKQTLVTELPVEILRLDRLRQLIVYSHAPHAYLNFEHILGFKPPLGIGSLSRLQSLSYVELNHHSGIIKDLANMIDLRRLSITKLRTEDGKALCSSIEKLQKLRSLSVRSIAKHEALDLVHISSPPPLLHTLYLKGHLGNVPRWIQSLHALVKVYFQWSRLVEDPLEHLEDLPNLVHLEILEGYTGESLHFKAGKFSKLKLLDLDRLEELKSVTMEKNTLPRLEKLVIQKCNVMERVPLGIEFVSSLKFLEFFDMPDEFVNTFLPEKQGVDYCRVAHIPEVHYTYWRGDCWVVYSVDDKCLNENHNKSSITAYGRRNWL